MSHGGSSRVLRPDALSSRSASRTATLAARSTGVDVLRDAITDVRLIMGGDRVFPRTKRESGGGGEQCMNDGGCAI